jgi:predicted transcriptional regulator
MYKSTNEKQSHSHNRIKASGADKATFAPLMEQLCEKDVVCLKPSDTIFDAAERMCADHVGNVVIIDERSSKKIPVGMLTDRDIVINSIAKKLNPESVQISDIMSKKVVTASEDIEISELIQLITTEGVSRLPIVDSSGALIGILSSKRLFQYLAQGLCLLSSLSIQQQKREEKMH